MPRKAGQRSKTQSGAGLESRDVERLAGYQLRRVGALVVRELAAIFSEVGLAPGQFGILTMIAQHSGRTQTQMAAMARIDRSTLVPVIDRLEALGFVKRMANANDRRAYALEITAKGRKSAAKILPALEAFEERLSVAMTKKEKAGLLIALQKIETAITQQ